MRYHNRTRDHTPPNMQPITLRTRDATRLAIMHCRAAQSRAHRHHLLAMQTVARLMRSSTANWSTVCHWAGMAKYYEQAARTHQRAAAYFARNLNSQRSPHPDDPTNPNQP